MWNTNENRLGHIPDVILRLVSGNVEKLAEYLAG